MSDGGAGRPWDDPIIVAAVAAKLVETLEAHEADRARRGLSEDRALRRAIRLARRMRDEAQS